MPDIYNEQVFIACKLTRKDTRRLISFKNKEKFPLENLVSAIMKLFGRIYVVTETDGNTEKQVRLPERPGCYWSLTIWEVDAISRLYRSRHDKKLLKSRVATVKATKHKANPTSNFAWRTETMVLPHHKLAITKQSKHF